MDFENNKNCVCNILKLINKLQQKETRECEIGCDRPILGGDCFCDRPLTRPFMLFNREGMLFEVNTNISNLDEKSSIFRVEKMDGCCATLRVLRVIPSPDDGSNMIGSTDQFVNIDTNCFCGIKCLGDVDLNNNVLITNAVVLKDGVVIDTVTFPLGVHFFEVIDPNNEDVSPTYTIEIILDDLANSGTLSLVDGINVDNPNFTINSYSLNNNILTINFTVNTSSLSNELSITQFEQTQEVGTFTFAVANGTGAVVALGFTMTVVTVYP